MGVSYKILYGGGEGELVEKKSRFIATLRPVESEEEAVLFIAEMKKKYWDASHNCSAFTVGERNEITRCSDDGEPAQTAGRPMLNVLLGEEIHNVCAVVTRYFGGTLLGTGGLVRAYSGAVREGLKNCRVLEKCAGRMLKVETDYPDLGRIQYILGAAGIDISGTEYSDRAVLMLPVPLEKVGDLTGKLTEGTGGRCRIEDGGELFFGKVGGEILLL